MKQVRILILIVVFGLSVNGCQDVQEKDVEGFMSGNFLLMRFKTPGRLLLKKFTI